MLVLPSTAVAAAWAQLEEKDHPVLDVLLRLPVTVVDDLTATRARAVGMVGGGTQPAAHALLCAADRGWPLVTGDADQYADVPDGVSIEPLP